MLWTVAASVALCEPQLEHAGSSLTEEFMEGRHFVCAIDEVNHEHVGGFPVDCRSPLLRDNVPHSLLSAHSDC